MLRNYFSVVLRNAFRNKLQTLLVLAGLAAGIASCMLIFLYVQDELSYDKHHTKADRTYRLTTRLVSKNAESDVAYAPTFAAEALVHNYPEVETVTRLLPYPVKATVQFEDKQFDEKNIWYADSSVFQTFTYRFYKGNPLTALAAPESAVITQSVAGKYFGTGEAMGKMLYINDVGHTVMAIIEDSRENTDIEADIILNGNEEIFDDWAFTFIVFRSQAAGEGFKRKLKPFIARHVLERFGEFSDDFKVDMYLEPLPELHFSKGKLYDTPKANLSYVYSFSLIAFFILVIACINYLNISLAQSYRRLKEIGVRKVIGATRQQLAFQLTFEAFFLLIVALGIAVVLVVVFLPVLGQISDKSFEMAAMLNWRTLVFLACVLVLLGLIAGGYPSFYVSSFEPTQIISSKLPSLGKKRLRNVLMTLQLTISIVLLICTLTVNQQMQFFRNYNLGFKKDQVLVLDLPRDEDAVQNAALIKEKLAALSDVNSVSIGGVGSEPGTARNRDAFIVRGAGRAEQKVIDNVYVDNAYFKLLNVRLVAGSDFSEPSDADDANIEIIVNEAFVKSLGLTGQSAQAVGRQLYTNEGFEGRIVGVVQDFHISSLHNKIPPVLFINSPGNTSKVFVSLNTGQLPGTIARIESAWKEVTPAYEFAYSFLDSNFERSYQYEERMLLVYSYFAAVNLIIVCMGIFALSSLIASLKAREVSIRKVFGADTGNISYLMMKDFIAQVAVAFALSCPMALYLMRNWLQAFAYRTDISWTAFAIAGVIAMAAVVGTLAYHTRNILKTNVLTSLRYS